MSNRHPMYWFRLISLVVSMLMQHCKWYIIWACSINAPRVMGYNSLNQHTEVGALHLIATSTGALGDQTDAFDSTDTLTGMSHAATGINEIIFSNKALLSNMWLCLPAVVVYLTYLNNFGARVCTSSSYTLSLHDSSTIHHRWFLGW